MDERGKARQGLRNRGVSREEVLAGEPNTDGFVVFACPDSSVLRSGSHGLMRRVRAPPESAFVRQED